MKILYLHQYFATPSMPGGTRSYETARRLSSWGHEVEVLTSNSSSGKGRGWDTSFEEGVKVHWASVRYHNEMSYPRRSLSFFFFSLKTIFRVMRLDADIVFASSTPLTIVIPAIFFARLRRVPLVFEVRDLWPETAIAVGALRHPILVAMARRLEKWAYFSSRAVIALSPEMKKGIVATGYPRELVAVVPNACDFDLFEANHRGTEGFFSIRPHLVGRPFVLYAGAFGVVNDLSYAVELALRLQSIGSKVAILLVGEGKEKLKVVKLGKEYGVLDDNLFIEAATSKREIVSAFAAASCIANFVSPIPALHGNSANKFFDGLAAGKPIMVNFEGWMTSLVRQNNCGLYVTTPPTATTARQIDRALSDRSWLTEAGLNSRKVGISHFGRDALVRQVESVLESAVSGDGHLPETVAPGNYK
jgi:glycosyltransferase involved in cell wall biosynthesis